MTKAKTFLTASPFKDLDELVHIVVNLRRTTVDWNRYYGSAAREKKEYWEKKADKWLQDHLKKENQENENTEVPAD